MPSELKTWLTGPSSRRHGRHSMPRRPQGRDPSAGLRHEESTQSIRERCFPLRRAFLPCVLDTGFPWNVSWQIRVHCRPHQEDPISQSAVSGGSLCPFQEPCRPCRRCRRAGTKRCGPRPPARPGGPAARPHACEPRAQTDLFPSDVMQAGLPPVGAPPLTGAHGQPETFSSETADRDPELGPPHSGAKERHFAPERSQPSQPSQPVAPPSGSGGGHEGRERKAGDELWPLLPRSRADAAGLGLRLLPQK